MISLSTYCLFARCLPRHDEGACNVPVLDEAFTIRPAVQYNAVQCEVKHHIAALLMYTTLTVLVLGRTQAAKHAIYVPGTLQSTCPGLQCIITTWRCSNSGGTVTLATAQ
eukprot:17591-Heterococcus_DN1.PRE.2